jgi:co-chaperonin GroES (HSP10)
MPATASRVSESRVSKETHVSRETLADDPKRLLLDKIGDISGFEIAHNELLVAIYMRPEMTSGGIVLPHQNLKEDRYQGKAHLVVKIGPGCQFKNVDVQLHDWVLLRPSDAWSLDVNAHLNTLDIRDFVPCRLVYDDQIRARIPHPGMIW